MAGMDRIGAAGGISRDTASAGLEAQDKAQSRELEGDKRVNQQLKDGAKLYEKQFLREMVKAMRGTVSFGAMKPSMAENIYREQLDEQYVESWGDLGGIGLADLIYDQIAQHLGASTRASDASPEETQTKADASPKSRQPREPIPLSDKDVFRIGKLRTAETTGSQIPLKVELKNSKDGTPAKLQAPWDATVVGRARLEGGKTALTLQHEGPNLRSTLIFQGTPAAEAQPGAKIAQGRTIGVLSPESRTFFWNLNKMGMNPLDSGPGAQGSSEVR